MRGNRRTFPSPENKYAGNVGSMRGLGVALRSFLRGRTLASSPLPGSTWSFETTWWLTANSSMVQGSRSVSDFSHPSTASKTHSVLDIRLRYHRHRQRTPDGVRSKRRESQPYIQQPPEPQLHASWGISQEGHFEADVLAKQMTPILYKPWLNRLTKIAFNSLTQVQCSEGYAWRLREYRWL